MRAKLVLGLLRGLDIRAGVVLVYHRVGAHAGDPVQELVPNIGVDHFRAHVRYLQRHWNVVRASELVDAVSKRRRGDPYPLALTFDDDLASHFDVVLPILLEVGAPATFFLNGRRLSGRKSYWWVDLELALGRDRIARLPHVADDLIVDALARKPRAIHRAAKEIERLPAEQLAEVAALLEQATSDLPKPELMEPPEIRSLVVGGMELGFHTRDHAILTGLDHDRLERSLADGRSELASIAKTRLDLIAYPHGKADERVAEATRAAGFTFGFTGRRQRVTPGGSPWLLGRLEPSPMESAAMLATRIVKLILSGDPRRSHA